MMIRAGVALLFFVAAGTGQVVTGVYDASAAVATRPFRQQVEIPVGPCFAAQGWVEVRDAGLYRCFMGLWTQFSTAGGVPEQSCPAGAALAGVVLAGQPTCLSLGYQQIRVNSGVSALQRPRANLVAGPNVTITAVDAEADDETVLTISSSGGGGGGTLATQTEAHEGTNNTNFMSPLRTHQAIDHLFPWGLAYANMFYGVDAAGNRTLMLPLGIMTNSGSSSITPARGNLRLIAGANMTITGASNGANDSYDVTFHSTGGSAGSGRVINYVGINSGSVPAWGFSLPLSGAPVLVAVEEGGLLFSVARFTADNQSVQGSFLLATAFSSITARLEARSLATSGNMVFALRTACVGQNETEAAATWNTEQTITMAASTLSMGKVVSSPLSVHTTGCSSGEKFYWQLSRSSSTTVTNPPELLGLTMEIAP